ncbi:MAG: hypothetical protein KDA92_00665 [Planctomycetales bacterium]|nr:hypothetical protein [Planctomycetales bacterium]
MSDEIRAQLISPEVHADRRVTFRIRAPHAQSITIEGLPTQPLQLTRQDAEIWTGTTLSLPSGLHAYYLEIDGNRLIDPSNRDVKKWLSLSSQLEVPGHPPHLHELTSVPHGSVHLHTYHSLTTSSEREVYVYTPPGYSPTTTQDLPVLYLLHGYGDDASAWTQVGRVHRIADNLLSQGKITPALIVMPDGHPLNIDLQRDFDDYADENRQLLERELLHDLIPYVEAQYLSSRGATRRWITGLSMGGGQSLHIGLSHPSVFSAVGAFSAAAPYAAQWDALFNPLKLNPLKPGPELPSRPLWIGCGEDDFLLKRNLRFIDQLRERQIAHEWHLTSGGHDWYVWRDYIARFLTWTSESLQPS